LGSLADRRLGSNTPARNCERREKCGVSLTRQANIARIERKSGLEPSSALNQLNNEHDDGNHEQKMNQSAAKVADEAKKPEHDQDNNYSPEHWYSFRLS
jgi:hypothetical protein